MAFDAETWIQNTFFSFQHAYDPVKAREYYLKTRELKGRKKGVEKAPTSVDKLPSWVTDTVEVEDTSDNIKKVSGPVKPTVDAGALREAATKRQAQLRARLERLEGVLADLVEKSAQAAGADTKESTEKSKETEKSDSKEKEKPKTAAEKKDAAKKAKEDYEKNKKPESSPSDQDLQNQIEAIQKKITDARASLQSAIARAKAIKPKPKPASGVSPAKPPAKPTKTAQAVATPKKGDSQNGS